MWKVFREARKLAIAVMGLVLLGVATTGEANAQSTFINQNISGFNLPGVQLPSGHDEVRAADGTTCRSAVSGDGAYLDVGLIGNPEANSRFESDSSFSAYTRVVVPLGQKRSRIDCTKLYNLEVRRLEIELKLVELGLARGIAPVSEVDNTQAQEPVEETQVAQLRKQADAQAQEDDWASDGWSDEGLEERQE